MWNLEFGKVWTTGIDWNLPGNGGPECAAYLSPQRKILEFLLGTTVAMISLFFGWRLHSPPSPSKIMSIKHTKQTSFVSRILLIAMILTYLVEISYKFYTYQAVFILNPCHCLCIIQIVVLSALCNAISHDRPPSMMITYTFRIHLYLLHGPL